LRSRELSKRLARGAALKKRSQTSKARRMSSASAGVIQRHRVSAGGKGVDRAAERRRGRKLRSTPLLSDRSLENGRDREILIEEFSPPPPPPPPHGGERFVLRDHDAGTSRTSIVGGSRITKLLHEGDFGPNHWRDGELRSGPGAQSDALPRVMVRIHKDRRITGPGWREAGSPVLWLRYGRPHGSRIPGPGGRGFNCRFGDSRNPAA